MINSKETAPRYSVRLVNGPCLGAGAFVVWDGTTGEALFAFYIYKDDADKVAGRLNTHEQAGA
jgi:hypothetical protein